MRAQLERGSDAGTGTAMVDHIICMANQVWPIVDTEGTNMLAKLA